MSKLMQYLNKSVAEMPMHAAIVYRENNIYTPMNYKDMDKAIQSLSYHLRDYKHKTIAIIGNNKLELVVSLIAILGNIGNAFMIDKDLKQSEIDQLFQTVTPDLIIKDDVIEYENKRIPVWSFSRVRDLMNIGDIYIDMLPVGGNLILHTSGTTGAPKCLSLSERNYTYIVPSLNTSWKVGENKSCFFIIPLFHIYALTSLFHSLYGGVTIILEYDYKRLSQALQSTNPSIFLGVPLIFNNIYQKIMRDNKKQVLTMVKISNTLLKKDIDCRKIIFKKIHKYFGKNYYFSVCGGSIANPEIIQFFNDVGLPVYNGYGMTETSGPIAINYQDNNDVHSVGKVLKNEVKIVDANEDGIGEIAIKGDNIITNYIGEDTMLVDEYFPTGDLGYLSNGFLYVTGRKKAILIGDNGKNIATVELVNKIMKNTSIKDCTITMTDNRLCAVIDTDMTYEELQLYINIVNEELPKYKQISEIKLIRKGVSNANSTD